MDKEEGKVIDEDLLTAVSRADDNLNEGIGERVNIDKLNEALQSQ